MVVPAYNVDTQIAGVLEGIPGFVDDVIAVEDVSQDETVDVLTNLEGGRIEVVRHPVNRGVGGAMVSGFRRALQRGADLVVKMDGDGQMDPAFLPALLDPIVVEGYGYAKGNRFLCQEHLNDMPKVRMLGSFALTFLAKLASGYWHVFDPVNGFVAIDARTLRKLPLDRLAQRYFFEIDMLIKLNVFRTRVKDVPIPPRYGDERSSMRLGRIVFGFPPYLVHGFWYRIYQRHVLREFSPVALFWFLGTLFLGWGTGFGAYAWIKSGVSGHLASTGAVMLSVLPLIIGFQLVLQAILIEIHDSPR